MEQECSQQYGSSMSGGQEQECSVLHLCWREKKEPWGSAHRVGRTAEQSAFSLNAKAVHTGENVFFFVILCLPDQRSEGSKRWGSAHRGGELWSGAKVGERCLLCHPLLAGLAIICCQLAPKDDKIGRFGS